MATTVNGTKQTQPTGTGTSERSIGQLVSDATADLSSILRGEIELAKVEVKKDAVNAGKGAGMFAGAAILGLYAFGLILLTIVWALAETGMALWLCFLIVAVVLLIVAAVLALIGKKNVSKVQGKPAKTIDNAQKTMQAIKPASPSAS